MIRYVLAALMMTAAAVAAVEPKLAPTGGEVVNEPHLKAQITVPEGWQWSVEERTNPNKPIQGYLLQSWTPGYVFDLEKPSALNEVWCMSSESRAKEATASKGTTQVEANAEALEALEKEKARFEKDGPTDAIRALSVFEVTDAGGVTGTIAIVARATSEGMVIDGHADFIMPGGGRRLQCLGVFGPGTATQAYYGAIKTVLHSFKPTP